MKNENENSVAQPLSLLLFTELASEIEFGEYNEETDLGEFQGQVLSPVKHNQEA